MTTPPRDGRRDGGLDLLFVCTGNICRSPTAERLVLARGTAGVRATSAGTRAVVGHGVQSAAAEVLRGLGGDPTGFRARQLTAAQVAGADLVLALTTAHRDAVLALAPRALRRTFTLLEAAALAPNAVGDDPVAALHAARPGRDPALVLDVADPIGRDTGTYRRVGTQISTAVDAVLAALARDGSRPVQ